MIPYVPVWIRAALRHFPRVGTPGFAAPRVPPDNGRHDVHLRSQAPFRWAVPMLCALLWAAFLWALTRSATDQYALLLDWGALYGTPVGTDGVQVNWLDPGPWLRLFTALFLHADWAHLLGNLVFLLIFGLPAERLMGAWRLLLLFLVGGALANLAAVLVIGAPDRLIIGASGAVSALIGAYLALFPRARLGLFLEFVRAPASLLIGIWAVLQVFFAYIGPAYGAVAWAAHVAGFLFGVVFALLSRHAIGQRLRRLKGY